MEEEIITPEEEVFDYQKLRYILDKDGYIFHASFGGLIICDLGECTEYTGDVPDGYSTIEKWFEKENEKLNAWKIVEGNLVFDENKYNKLKARWENEEYENSCASKKYVNDKFSGVNTVYDDELSSKIEGSSLFIIENAKDAGIAEMNITPNEAITDNFKIKITNENMLGNKSADKEENGLSFKVNEDKSITINGTATADTEFIINGSSTSTDILFFLKKNQDYMQCGLADGVSINLYNFDGNERSLISSLENGTINLSSTSYITYVTLNISSGTKLDNVTIYPMIKVGAYSNDTEYEYIQCEENDLLNIDLGEYTFENDDNVLVDRTKYTFTKNIYLYPADDLYPSDDLYPIDYDEKIKGNVETQKTFQGKTLIQCDKDVSFEVKYFSNDYLNERFASIKVEQDEIKLEVGKKVGNDEIISKINQSPEAVGINANKIELSANDVLNLLAGNTINLSSQNITISSSSLNIDKNGKMTFYSEYIGEVFEVKENANSNKRMYINRAGLVMDAEDETGLITLGLINENEGSLRLSGADGYTRVRATGITTPVLTQTSKESRKKNIVKYSKNALDIVKDSEIYEYNFKSEDDSDKKHIGFVIGDEGGKYKTPEQVISNDRNGIDTYSMCSILWKAVQEQQRTIEELTKEIDLLKGEK